MILSVEDLVKEYPPQYRLGPISFTVNAGETIAILGHNGAGKSTLFHLLTGNSDATSGAVMFRGERLSPERSELRRQIGYLPQNPPLPDWASGIDLMRYALSLHGDIGVTTEAIMKTWDWASYARKPLAACSYGMRKRIALSLACFHDPDVLILDEPFSGLDLLHLKTLTQVIAERRVTGKATILSTHSSHFVATLCSQVYLLSQGRLNLIELEQGLSLEERIGAIEEAFFVGS